MIEKIKCLFKMFFINLGRGCIFYQYFVGCFRNRRRQRKGKSAEGAKKPEAWFLGMSVKNGMTVIERWSAIQRKHVMIS